MSRSPFFSTVRRMLQTAWVSGQSGVPVDELSEHLEGLGSASRRDFLQVSLGVAAAAVLPFGASACRAQPRAEGQGAIRVAVIGAGMAGLHCAYRLKQAGVIADVYEASKRVGGRMFTARGKYADEQVAELGGELINTNHVAMHALARELDVQVDDLLANAPEGYHHEIFYFEGREILESEIIEAFKPLAQTMAATVKLAEAQDDEFKRVDAMNIVQWLDAQGVEPILKRILIEAYTAEYGRDAEEQSVFNLLYLIDFETTDSFLLLGESDERFHVHSGNDTLTTRLAMELGAQISLETVLVGIKQESNQSYTLSLERAGEPILERYEHVVLAIPFTTLRKVRLEVEMDALKREVIEQVDYGTNAKLMSGFSSRVWREEHNAAGTAITDGGFHCIWDTSRGQGGAGGLLTNFVGGTSGMRMGQGTPEERLVELLPRVEQIFPGAAAAYVEGSAIRVHWPSVPYALGSYTCYSPGQWAYYGQEGRRVGNLHFAGEHCSQDFQGFMEGACETGLLAAAEVLDDLKVPVPVSALGVLEHKLRYAQACYHGDRDKPLRAGQRRRAGRQRRALPALASLV